MINRIFGSLKIVVLNFAKLLISIFSDNRIKFGGLYFLSIFLFAFIYNFIAEDFFHSTVKQERYYHQEKAEIDKLLTDEIQNIYESRFTEEAMKSAKVRFSLVALRLSKLNVKQKEIDFQIDFLLHEKDSIIEKPSIYKYKGILNISKYSNLIDTITGKDYSLLIRKDHEERNMSIRKRSKIVYFHSLSLTPIKDYNRPEQTNLFNELLLNGDTIQNRIISSYELRERLKRLSLANNGFPFSIEGRFSRMLYFSATTQTGLGPGDILPLTERARLLVVVQVIIGIIIIGLFLNAVISKLKNNTSD